MAGSTWDARGMRIRPALECPYPYPIEPARRNQAVTLWCGEAPAGSAGRNGLDRVGGRRGSVRPLDRARREDRLAPVADGKRRGDEAIEQRVRSLGS